MDSWSRLLAVMPMQPESTNRLCGPLLALGFGLAPRRKLALLRSIVRTRFKFVGFAAVAIEMQNLLLIHRHGPASFARNQRQT